MKKKFMFTESNLSVNMKFRILFRMSYNLFERRAKKNLANQLVSEIMFCI